MVLFLPGRQGKEVTTTLFVFRFSDKKIPDKQGFSMFGLLNENFCKDKIIIPTVK